jgi:outer membrane biosynthesis protein TonB
VLQQGVIAMPPRPPVLVTVLRPAPVVAPRPAPKPVPKLLPKPVPKPMIVVKAPRLREMTRAQAPPRPRPAPPVNHFAAAMDNGLNLNLAPPPSGTGHGSMGAFDDAVKQQIMAHKTYPPGLKGMWDECVVSYRVTVDRSGQMLSYQLFGCGNPFLDSAARAAILLANPFPVPPDFGGSHDDVYGSLVFRGQ